MDMVTTIRTGIQTMGELVSLQAFSKYRKQLIDLQRTLISAQEEILEFQNRNTSLIAEVDELKKTVVDLKDWKTEKASYEIVEFLPRVFVYGRKATVQTTEPAHWLCCPCYDKGKKSILQFQHQLASPAWRCNACRTDYPLPPPPMRQMRITR